MEQGNTPIYKHIKLLSHYSNISNNEFDIPSIIFERFAYLKPTPKAYMLKISPPPPPKKEKMTVMVMMMVMMHIINCMNLEQFEKVEIRIF